MPPHRLFAAPMTPPRRWVAPGLIAVASVLALAAVSPLLSTDLRGLWVLLVLSPLCEEIVFRAGLQTWVRRRLARHKVQASRGVIVLVALAFGLAHAVLRGPALGVAVLAPALFIGWLHERYRSTALCVLVHALFNLVWLALAGPLFVPLFVPFTHSLTKALT